MIFKRAEGQGLVRRYDGLAGLMADFGEHVANLELTPIGEPRRDWQKVVVGDGWIVVRHPELDFTTQMADRFCSDLQVVAE